jgi:CelD/BcsL family acetyltransferase involved in cellulose biosynthesis
MAETAAKRRAAGQVLFRDSQDDRYEVLVDHRDADVVGRWNANARSAAAMVFQTSRWLDAWYSTIGRVVGQPLLVTILDRGSGELAAMLPLVLRTDGIFRTIEFADANVSDYNAPVLGPAAPTDGVGAQRLWSAVQEALPNADFLRFQKMPREVEGRVNPLVLLPQAEESPINSNVVIINGNWSDYIKSLERTFRKELGRSWRVFCAHDGAMFRRIEDRAESSKVLAELDRQQRNRLREKGEYQIDKPEYAEFYQKLVADGISEGGVILTALTCRDEVVAALLGVTRGAAYVMTRICSGSAEWSNCSPGRLVITQTMQMLHAQGYRHFDFSIGDYAYKRRLGVSSQPLFRLRIVMSIRGWTLLAYDQTKDFIKQHPAILTQAKRLRSLRSGAPAPQKCEMGPAERPASDE